MSYIGAKELKASDIRRFDVTSSTSATHTLTWTAPNEQSLIVTINGVKQQEDAYSVSGVTLTLTSALVSTDKLEVIGINDIGTTITPAQNSVDTDKILDDAVTAAKLANSINTEIAANTAKVTNATHTGDVTGATALTIATDAVDIAMLSATGTASATTFLRGDNAWASAGGDNTPSFRAYLSTNQTGLTNSAWQKMNFNTEDWDTDSAYDHATNYRFTVPAGEGGKYVFVAAVGIAVSAGADGAGDTCNLTFYVNGAQYTKGSGSAVTRAVTVGQDNYTANTTTFNLSASDYVECYVYHNMGTSRQAGSATSYFSGYKLVGV